MPYLCRRMLTGIILSCISLSFLAGCESDDPDDAMPDRKVGIDGETATIVGISSGESIVCRTISDEIWEFDVDFSTSDLNSPLVAELIVVVYKDTNGNDMWGSNMGPYIQMDSDSVSPDRTSGVLKGRLGPPVGTKTRFSLAVRLIDSNNVIAISSSVGGLQPVLQ